MAFMPGRTLNERINKAIFILGQPGLYADRLAKASKLKAIIKVETNFYPNIDHDCCAKNGFHVLTSGSAFASVVAEISLAMAIDLARSITTAEGHFRKNLLPKMTPLGRLTYFFPRHIVQALWRRPR